MTLPATISVSFDFSQGATFGFNGFIIGDAINGVIGTSQFAASAVQEPVVDLSSVTRQIKISRGRNIMRDTYEAGTCTVRVLDPDSNFNPQNASSPYFGFLTPLRKIRVAATTFYFQVMCKITNTITLKAKKQDTSIYLALMLFVY